MARVELSELEIIEELRGALRVKQPDPPGVFVISELAKKSGVSQETLRKQVRALMEQGRIEQIHVQRDGSDGRLLRKIPAYRILAAAKKARS